MKPGNRRKARCRIPAGFDEQSSDIAIGGGQKLSKCKEEASCDLYDEIGAGDQGIMFGFACTKPRS